MQQLGWIVHSSIAHGHLPFRAHTCLCVHTILGTGVSCDVCAQSPIIGTRYKSLLRPDWDCCRKCFSALSNEPMGVIAVPAPTAVFEWRVS